MAEATTSRDQPDHVHYTLYIRELCSCHFDGVSFTVARPPGHTVNAQKVRLLGDVIEADGDWLVLDDSTASVEIFLLNSERPTVGTLVEVIGELQVGCRPHDGPWPDRRVQCVHIRARHLCVHEDPEYRTRRWRTLDQQRCSERDAPRPPPMAPATSLAPFHAPAATLQTNGISDPPAAAMQTNGALPVPTLRDAVLEHLAAAAGGLSYTELHGRVTSLLAASNDGGAAELGECLAALEEDMVIYRNGDRFCQL